MYDCLTIRQNSAKLVMHKKKGVLKMDWQTFLTNFVTTIVNWATTSGIRLIIALVIMFISFKVVNLVSKRIRKSGDKGRMDKTIAHTLAYIVKISAKVIITISLIGYVGIDTSGLAALVVSLGACVGLALNGTVANLAGGILIIVTRPFKVDDYIEAQGHSGTVEDIHITYTKLVTPDNKVVYIPNGPLSTGNIVNYSVKDTRRVDFTFSIGYENDYERARQLILDICNSHGLVLKDPEPMVRMSEHADSYINIVTRVWVNSADYWTVNFDIIEAVKAEFDRQGIEIPYNQLDVHIKKD